MNNPTTQTSFPPRAAAVLCILLGFCPAFPILSFSLPLLVLLYPVGTAMLGMKAGSDRQAFFQALLAAGAGHAAALIWMRIPMSVVGGLPMIASVLLTFVACLMLSSQAGLFAVAARRLWQPELLRSACAMGLVWYFLEYGYALTLGFPWLPLSGALAKWSWTMQLADTLGAYLTSSLWLMAAFLLAGFLLKRQLRLLAAGTLIAAGLAGYGLFSLASSPMVPCLGPEAAAKALPNPADDKDVFPVLMADGNIDQNQKWVESYRTGTVRTYVKLSKEALARVYAQTPSAEESQAMRDYLSRGLILWSETAMPFDLPTSPHTASLIELARSSGMALITGAPGFEKSLGSRDYTVYNRIWLITPQGLPGGSYDKEHLVPFGEYIPACFRWHFLDGLMQGVGQYTEGTRTAPLHHGRLALGPLVCYEGIFPWLAQERVSKGANVLLDVSNDGWFGATAAPWQHLYLTGLRALEQNRWLVRCTNTGISAVYDNRGRIVLEGPQFVENALWGSARTIEATSRFHSLFYILPAVCALILILCVFSMRRKGQLPCNN